MDTDRVLESLLKIYDQPKRSTIRLKNRRQSKSDRTLKISRFVYSKRTRLIGMILNVLNAKSSTVVWPDGLGKKTNTPYTHVPNDDGAKKSC